MTKIKETILTNESIDKLIKKNNKNKQQAKINDIIGDFILIMNMIFSLVAIVTEVEGEKTISDLFYDFTSASVIITVIITVIIKRCLPIKRKFKKSVPKKTKSKTKSSKKSKNNKTNSSKSNKNKSNNSKINQTQTDYYNINKQKKNNF